jgi:glycosyltransferase involved in cell wall biosynthesis
MRILHVISYLNPKRGGDVYVCHMMCKYLHQRGHEVSILTTNFNADYEFIQNIQNEGISVVTIPFVFCSNLFVYSPDMKKWIHQNIKKFDIIHCHNYRSYQNMQISALAQRYKIPYIIQTHGDIPYFNQRTILKKIYDFFIGNQTLSKAGKIFALTNSEKTFLSRHSVLPSKITIIPNGIEVSNQNIINEKGKFKERIGFSHYEKFILFIGRLHKTKGLDLLLDAFIHIHGVNNEIKLVIIGPDYGYRKHIENRINSLNLNKDILILNYIDESAKNAAYHDADVFVTPEYSGFPITFLEACSAGLPIVTTTHGDSLDWIDGHVGFVVEATASLIGSSILQILNDEVLHKKFAQNGREIIEELFNWQRIISLIEKEYQIILQQ